MNQNLDSFMGFLGTITGVSDKQMAISEIGVTFPDDTFGKEVSGSSESDRTRG